MAMTHLELKLYFYSDFEKILFDFSIDGYLLSHIYASATTTMIKHKILGVVKT
jgi:hypothetical protein